MASQHRTASRTRSTALLLRRAAPLLIKRSSIGPETNTTNGSAAGATTRALAANERLCPLCIKKMPSSLLAAPRAHSPCRRGPSCRRVDPWRGGGDGGAGGLSASRARLHLLASGIGGTGGDSASPIFVGGMTGRFPLHDGDRFHAGRHPELGALSDCLAATSADVAPSGAWRPSVWLDDAAADHGVTPQLSTRCALTLSRFTPGASSSSDGVRFAGSRKAFLL